MHEAAARTGRLGTPAQGKCIERGQDFWTRTTRRYSIRDREPGLTVTLQGERTYSALCRPTPARLSTARALRCAASALLPGSESVTSHIAQLIRGLTHYPDNCRFSHSVANCFLLVVDLPPPTKLQTRTLTDHHPGLIVVSDVLDWWGWPRKMRPGLFITAILFRNHDECSCRTGRGYSSLEPEKPDGSNTLSESKRKERQQLRQPVGSHINVSNFLRVERHPVSEQLVPQFSTGNRPSFQFFFSRYLHSLRLNGS